MKNETISKLTMGGRGKAEPVTGETPASQTNAEIGALTKSSSGEVKSSTSTMKARETTSTRLPKKPVPEGFLEKLGEMYTAERELVLALPLMAKAAKSEELKMLLRVHWKETKGHAKTLKEIADSLGRKLPMKRCPPVTKLIAEGTKVIAKRLVSSDQDAALIAVGRKVEQFEIDSYTRLCATAEKEDLTHERALLASILSQEGLAHELLGEVGAGKGPLDELVRKASLARARAR